MAGGALPGGGAMKDYPGKMTAYVIFTCFIGATGGLIFGYDLGVSGIKKKLFVIFFFRSRLQYGFDFFLYIFYFYFSFYVFDHWFSINFGFDLEWL